MAFVLLAAEGHGMEDGKLEDGLDSLAGHSVV